MDTFAAPIGTLAAGVPVQDSRCLRAQRHNWPSLTTYKKALGNAVQCILFICFGVRSRWLHELGQREYC
jgi:hypothetical protein